MDNDKNNNLIKMFKIFEYGIITQTIIVLEYKKVIMLYIFHYS